MKGYSSAYDTIHDDIGEIAGCELANLTIHAFRVDLVFADDSIITVSLQKRFNVSLESNEVSTFDPTTSASERGTSDARFVFLRGKRCDHVSLSESRFELVFADGCRLWMDLDTDDFEPLIFIGAALSDDPKDSLKFLYAL